MGRQIRATSFDEPVADFAPVALVVAARHREAPAQERPALHLPVPLPVPLPRDTVVPERAREQDADSVPPTRGVNVFDMV